MRPMTRHLLFVLLGAIFAIGLATGEKRWLVNLWADFGEDVVFLTGQHLTLVLISSGFAIIIGVLLGVWLSRSTMQDVAESLMQCFNVGTTVPTLAILALSMSFLGIGMLPSVFALWIATLLPIVRNTYAGLRAVSPHLIEAAIGMGMTPRQILWKVELPNALYVIFAGIRTALAINVGTVPLAFLIGGGGLGELIFTGIALDDLRMMLSGAIPVALLAILVDFIIGQTQYWFIPRGVNPLR